LSEASSLFRAGRLTEAQAIVEQHAADGEPAALFTLAEMHWVGIGVSPDLGRARELFGKAADVGHPIARRLYTNLLASGIAGNRDWARALERLEDEARADGLRNAMLSAIRKMQIDATGDPLSLVPSEQLSAEPHVRLFRGAFTPDECNYLKMLATTNFQRSVVNMDGKDVPDPIRTSDGATIHWLIEDPATHAINRRLAALTKTSVEQGEPLQILRYRPGQQYHPHFDWVAGPNRRILTALTYLNDDYEGGETSFVRTGLTVRGRMGDVLVFDNAGQDGNFDPLAEHCGMPVDSGTKYLASRWIRERAIRDWTGDQHSSRQARANGVKQQ
jgi:prolyl 4-hydroxylase